MKIAATANKVSAVDRISVEPIVAELKNNPEKKGKKSPPLRSLSFTSGSSNTDNTTPTPLTRELVRQGQITDMLMRSLNRAITSTPNSLPSSASVSAKAPVYVTPSFIPPLLYSSLQPSQGINIDRAITTTTGGSVQNSERRPRASVPNSINVSTSLDQSTRTGQLGIRRAPVSSLVRSVRSTPRQLQRTVQQNNNTDGSDVMKSDNDLGRNLKSNNSGKSNSNCSSKNNSNDNSNNNSNNNSNSNSNNNSRMKIFQAEMARCD